jgi:hypothetical protein
MFLLPARHQRTPDLCRGLAFVPLSFRGYKPFSFAASPKSFLIVFLGAAGNQNRSSSFF